MPASLLGLLAIATFYIGTVIVGLCADRCLALEEDDGNDPDNDRDRDDLDLLHLLENSLTRSNNNDDGQSQLLQTGAPTFSISSIAPRQQLQPQPVRNCSAAQKLRMVGVQYSSESAPVELVANNLPPSQQQANCARAASPRRAASQNDFGARAAGGMTTAGVSALSALHEEENDRWNRPYMQQRPVANHERPADVIRASSVESSTTLSLQPPPRLPTGGRYLLAERNIGAILGSLSLLAIRVGGAFPTATAQQVYEQGLLWCQLPVAQSISLLLAGALFSRYLYSEGHVTIIDPFQAVYGIKIGLLVFLPVLAAELTFACVVISSMGALLQVTLDFSHQFGVVCSIVAILFYLVAGGLYAGTFTDGIQYIYLTFGMFILLPFVANTPTTSQDVGPVTQSHSSYRTGGSSNYEEPNRGPSPPRWLGELTGQNSGLYIDQFAVLILGGIPMQSYFQRVLSSKTSRVARTITISASLGCLFNSVPAVVIGAVAISAEWQNTTLGQMPAAQNSSLVLPFSMAYLAPKSVTFLALGALGSGLLASGDSAIFGVATIVTQNIYLKMLFPRSKDDRLIWVARLSTVLICGITLLLCQSYSSWHRHWILPYDLLYTLVFPQLFCVVYYKFSNSYGCISGLLVGISLRAAFGEAAINLPALLPLPFYSESNGQLFPYRTLAMFASLMTILTVSPAFHWLDKCGMLPGRCTANDFCFGRKNGARQRSIQQRRLERIAMRELTHSQQLAASANQSAVKGGSKDRSPSRGGNDVGARMATSDQYDSLQKGITVIERMTAL